MASKKTKIERLPLELINKINISLNKRLSQNLISRKDATMPEAFRLINRMPEFNICLNKLAKLPKKEDLK